MTLRDKINIPVRNQGLYGLCWDFASMKSLETYLALNGYGDFDFSELHVDYIESDEFGNSRKLHDGGNFSDFKEYLMYNYGPVFESEVPYSENYSIDEYDNLLNMEQRAFVGETVDFPYLTKNPQNVNYKPELWGDFRKKVKEHIMKNGSLYCGIISPQSQIFNYEHFALYFSGDWSILQNGRSDGHAVSIIGWDDNYSKENFNEDMRPEHDGAYIAVNSWGDSWGDNGVFYISYEDYCVEENLCGIISASTNINDVLKEVQFDDMNLYNEVKKILDRKVIRYNDESRTMYMTKLSKDSVYYLNLENKGISNINGIEKFSKLSGIYLSDNNIENIECLSNFDGDLMRIALTNNKVKDVSSLCCFNEVYLSGNPIEIGLDKLTKLSYLNLDNCNLTELLQISQLYNLGSLCLSNNNIEDVSCLKDLNIYDINLSGNKNLRGIENLTNLRTINLRGCSLDNNSLTYLTGLTKLNYLDLSNNNITDASELKKLNINHLVLSENKEIQINTIPTMAEIQILDDEYYGEYATSIILDNCNIDDISGLKDTNIQYISLCDNPISDLSPLKDNENVYMINLRNTNVSDVSALNKVHTIDLTGNKNLINLDRLESVYNLWLNECDINDFTFISSLTNLSEIYLENNNINGFPMITNESLWGINLSNNKLNQIPDFSGSKLGYIGLSGNEIEDISNLESKIGLKNDYVSINLSNNKIRQVPEIEREGISIDVSRNYISEIPEKGYEYYSNQEITLDYELQINKDNRIPLPGLLKTEYEKRYKNKVNFVTENCLLDYKTGEVIINPEELGEGNANIVITSDNWSCGARGTKVNFNFDAKENIDISSIEILYSEFKDIYFEGDSFDDSGLIIKAICENGISYTINDYQIIDGQNLNQNQDHIKIIYHEFELEIPIKVFPKDSYDIVFSNGLYYYIREMIKEGILYEDFYDNKVRSIVSKDIIDNLTTLNLSEVYKAKDFTGLSKLCNLKELIIASTRFENQEGFFAEICDLKKLEKLTLENCTYNSSVYPKEECVKEVLKLPNLKLVDFGEQNLSSHGYIYERACELPRYFTSEDIGSISVKIIYKNANDEDVTENVPIYVDKDNKLYVLYDTEVTETKKYETRILVIDVLTDKIKQKINFSYDWELDTDKPNVEIKGENLTQIEGAQQLTTKLNSVLYTFTWSENVYGFTRDSILVENGVKGEFTEVTPNRVYTLVVNNDVSEKQEVIQKVLVNKDVCTDLGSNGNVENSIRVIIDKKAPVIQINGDTLEGQEISIKFEDLSKITGWQITDKENEPTKWNTNIENNTIRYTVENGTKYVWAKDYLNNISHKAIISKGIEDKVEIKEYLLEDNIIKNVKQATTIADLKKNLIIKDLSYKIFGRGDKELKEDDLITTGSKVEISLNNEIIIYVFSVTGDTTGDGKADIKDILSINKHRLNKAKLENEYFIAGDINKDGKVDIKDILQLNKFRLGKINSL